MQSAPHLAVITYGSTLHSHAEQPAAVALIDLNGKMRRPAIITEGMSTFHSCGSLHRDVTKATPTFQITRCRSCRHTEACVAMKLLLKSSRFLVSGRVQAEACYRQFTDRQEQYLY